MDDNTLRTELNGMTVKELRVIASKLSITYSGVTKDELVNKILQADRSRLKHILGPLHCDPSKNELVLLVTDSWRWWQRIGCFFAVFGAIWLLLEPIAAFTTGAGILSLLGWWCYLLMVFCSLIGVLIGENWHKRRQLASIDYVAFFLIYVKSGRRIMVRAPLDVQIDSFLRYFSRRVGDLLPVECAAMHLYTHNLLVKTKTGFKPVDSNLTLREAMITEGTICRLRGYIRVEYTLPLLDIEYSWQPVRLELARARGLVVFDEMDSISFEDAKKQGLLNKSAIARVEHFSHSGEFFVVLCPKDEIDDVPELATPGEVP
jgi:hypothetical protein